jgi:hypothetical protein
LASREQWKRLLTNRLANKEFLIELPRGPTRLAHARFRDALP